MITFELIRTYIEANGWVKFGEPHQVDGANIFQHYLIQVNGIYNLDSTLRIYFDDSNKLEINQCLNTIGNIKNLFGYEVVQELLNQWLPFDPENVPEAKEGWSLIVKGPKHKNRPLFFECRNSIWVQQDDFPATGYEYVEGCQYKLVRLPQVI